MLWLAWTIGIDGAYMGWVQAYGGAIVSAAVF
jgi:hypothetical protein